jgi:hypothetical protein
MTNAGASASTFGMGKRHVPMPPEQGGSSLRDIPYPSPTGGAKAELHPRSFLRSLVETEIDLRAVESKVSQFPVIKPAQGGQRRLTLAICDPGCNPSVDKTARAYQEDSGSAPAPTVW